MTKKLLLPVLALFIFALPHAAQAEATKPALYAVAFHADWCGSCKILGPQVEKARGTADLDSKDVLFVKLDLTDKVTSHQSKLLADSLGFGALYTANEGKTGYVALIDPATGEQVTKLTKEHKAADITAAINEKLAAK